MAKFCIGDRVRISKSSELYSAGNTGSNPANIGGKILSNTCDGNYIYKVLWDNGQGNSYREIDLESDISVSFKYNIGEKVDYIKNGRVCSAATMGGSIIHPNMQYDVKITGRKFNDDVNWYLTEGYDNWLTEGSIKLTEERKESWCVKITEDNREIVKKWMDEISYTYSIGAYYGYDKDGRKKGSSHQKTYNILISTEEFYRKIGHKVEKGVVNPVIGNYYIAHTSVNHYSEDGAFIIKYKARPLDVADCHRGQPFKALNDSKIWGTEGGFHTIIREATKEETALLEPKIDFFTEAKKRYPVGTTYKCAYDKALYTIVEGDRYEDTSSGPIVYPKSGLSGKYLYLYHTKIWAEIVPKTVEKPLKKDHSHLIGKKFRITREPTSEEWGKMGRIPQEKMGRNNYIITNVKRTYEDGIYYIKNSNWWWPLSCIEVLSDCIPYIGENIITGWRYDGNTYIADIKQYPITSKTCIASENEYIQSPLSIKRPRKAKLIVV